jgi:hypothetical protein
MEDGNLSDKQQEDLKILLDDLKKGYRYNIENYDKQAIYISSGALAISLTFIKNIVPIDYLTNLWLYFCAISFLTISIILGLLSFLISSTKISRNLKAAENLDFEKYKNDSTTNTINWANGLLIVMGIIMLVIFTSINLSHYKSINSNIHNAMSDKETKVTNPNGDGYVIRSAESPSLPASLQPQPNTNTGGGNSTTTTTTTIPPQQGK